MLLLNSIRKQTSEDDESSLLLWMCAGHGMSSVGDKPTTGSYRQV